MENIDICTVLLDIMDDKRHTISWNPGDGMLYSDVTGLPYDWEKFDTLEEAVEECERRWGWGDAPGLYQIEWLYA